VDSGVSDTRAGPYTQVAAAADVQATAVSNITVVEERAAGGVVVGATVAFTTAQAGAAKTFADALSSQPADLFSFPNWMGATGEAAERCVTLGALELLPPCVPRAFDQVRVVKRRRGKTSTRIGSGFQLFRRRLFSPGEFAQLISLALACTCIIPRRWRRSWSCRG
jgi:hypothetical protein